MESIDLAMDDIFDGGLQEEDLVVPPPLPDLDDDTMAGGEQDGALNADGEEVETDAARENTPKSAVKKRVLRPQPKLDAERLQTARGLPMLPKLFHNTKFKGKGHEAEDLKLVMGKLEHWAHRLFPKLTFDDFSARLEKLGHTKPVQTCIKRIRLDMPVTGDDFTGNRDNDNISGNEDNDMDVTKDAPPKTTMNVEDAYEEMLQQERQQMALQKTATGNASPTAAAGASSDESSPRQLPCATQSASADMASPPMSATGLSPHRTPQTKVGSQQPSMTPDQLARIERNKQLAMQKRAARLGVPVTDLASPKPPSNAPSVTLQVTTSDTGDTETPTVTVTAPTPPRHQVSAVAMTTGSETNAHKLDSCDNQTRASDDAKSDGDSRVAMETTSTPYTASNDCSPDPHMQEGASRLHVPSVSFASPKPSSKQSTDLSGTISDDDTPTLTVTAPTPPRHPSSAVSVTTDTEANKPRSDCCDPGPQAVGTDRERSGGTSAVSKVTSGQDETLDKCTLDGDTGEIASRLGVPASSFASPKPLSADVLTRTSDIINGDTPTLTAPTPPRHLASAVAVTTGIQTDTE